MLVVIPIAAPEVNRAIQLLKWIHDLGPCTHKVVLLFANPVPEESIRACMSEAAPAFGEVVGIRQRESKELGWPRNANELFRTASEWMLKNKSVPFLWLEVDAIPVAQGWLDRIEHEYVTAGKPFLGAVYTQPSRHMNGVAVYPYNVSSLNPWMVNASLRPFDLTHPDIALNRGHYTKLIVRSLADPAHNLPHTFPTVESLSIIPAGCVLFHGNKDGTLIDRLREKHAKILAKPKPITFTATRNPSSITNPIRVNGVKRMISSSKLKLPEVTIWGTSWSEDSDMQLKTMRVLRYCDRIMKPARIVLFSFMPLPKDDYPFDIIQIGKLDWQKWNPFVNREVPKHIDTPFAMSVHEDGFPIDLECWNPNFLKWDYIGAPWTDGVVGNGGFNIESEKLMNEKMHMPTTPEEPITASDMYVCRNQAEYLKAQGIKFAPRDIALTFSTELFGNQWPSFGFHGRKVSPVKYQRGWDLIQQHEQ